MKKQTQYKYLHKYIIRTPAFSSSELSNLTADDLINICNQNYVSSAIYMASPELHKEMSKLINGKNVKNKDKLIQSIYKYLMRMSNRCSPFGLFCGTGIGSVGNKNSIEINSLENHRRLTRLDMNFLCALAMEIEKNEVVKNDLKFFPNSSLYRIADQLRYVEYRYEKSKRHNFTSSIDFFEQIDIILKNSVSGSTIEELAPLIVDTEISIDDAYQFLNELIENQILISEIHPSVTGDNFFNILKGKLGGSDIFKNLLKIEKILNKIDNDDISYGLNHIKDLINETNKLNVFYNKKYLVQTDLLMSFIENTISEDILQDIDDALSILNKLTLFEKNNNLVEFKNKFYERYEDQEIPLVLALDVESGIGYPVSDSEIFTVSPLIDDLDLTSSNLNNTKEKSKINLSRKDVILNKKIIEAIKNNEKEIILNQDDFSELEENWDNTPNSFSVFLSVVESDFKSTKLYISDVGGSSATCVLGRFCKLDKEIEKFVKEIIKLEDKDNEQKLYAEILHLPENRVGNILQRPNLRNYEIPYLAKSNLSINNQISINDIMISIKNDRIVLRSNSLKKEIITKLSTAHDYTINSLPIYHFLCDLQTQNIRGTLSFTWGNLFYFYDFFPRIVYKSIVLSPCTWVIKKKSLEKLKTYNIDSWRREYKIPAKIFLLENENELLIDFTNELSTDVFISSTKKKERIIITEYLYNWNKALVKQQSKAFANEIILSYIKN